VTVAEVAKLLRVSAMTVHRLVRRGDLAGKRFGAAVRVREADVQAYVDGADGASPAEAVR